MDTAKVKASILHLETASGCVMIRSAGGSYGHVLTRDAPKSMEFAPYRPQVYKGLETFVRIPRSSFCIHFDSNRRSLLFLFVISSGTAEYRSSMARFALHQDEATSHLPNPTSSPTSTSDKENRRQSTNKRSHAAMAPSVNKRPRLTDRNSNIQSQGPPPSQRNGDTRYYDPDQDADERRRVRRELRELNRELNGRILSDPE